MGIAVCRASGALALGAGGGADGRGLSAAARRGGGAQHHHRRTAGGDLSPCEPLQAAAEWSPWVALDPNIVQRFSGPRAGVGNRMEWSSEDPRVGAGSQEITRSVPDQRVETELDFGDMGTATAWIALAPQGTDTQVTWGLIADMGNTPIGRYVGLMMDRWVGADYEKGLTRLKSIVEAE